LSRKAANPRFHSQAGRLRQQPLFDQESAAMPIAIREGTNSKARERNILADRGLTPQGRQGGDDWHVHLKKHCAIQNLNQT
jgi:hypothetical protein